MSCSTLPAVAARGDGRTHRLDLVPQGAAIEGRAVGVDDELGARARGLREHRREAVDRLLRLGAGDREVVGGFAAGARRRAEQDQDDDRRGEAALPVLGKRAREAREEL